MSLDSAQTDEVTAPAYRRANFISIDFPSGMLAYTDLGYEYTEDSVTYVPGVINHPRGLKVTTDLTPKRISIVLPGTDSTLKAAIDTEDYQFVRVSFYMAVLDQDMQVITGLISQGKCILSNAIYELNAGEAKITLLMESLTAALLRKRRVTATDADQQWRYPGDKGFDLINLVEGSEDDWGGDLVGELSRREQVQQVRQSRRGRRAYYD